MSVCGKAVQVRYVGGPLDGLREVVPCDPYMLSELIAIPINANLLATIDGRQRGAKAPATSVAVYEMHITGGFFHYYFVGSTPAKQFCLEQWRG